MRRAINLEERREWDRLPIAIPFFVRGKKDSGEEFLEFATALNISAGGVLLATRRSLPVARSLSLEIPVAPLLTVDLTPESIRSIRAQPVRIAHGDRCNLVGLRFLRALPQ